MKLPESFKNHREWTLVGPMGPNLPSSFYNFPILGVDGGAAFSKRLDLWVGDGDSHSDLKSTPYQFLFSPDKSSSDLALSLSLVAEASPQILHLWGFLGGRRDHEIINLGEALHFLETHPKTIIFFYDSKGKAPIHCLGTGERSINHHGIFTLACMRPITFTLTGNCAYQVENSTELRPMSSLGLSNKAQGSFTLSSSGPTMLIFPELN